MGDVTGNLNSKRGQIENMGERGGLRVIDAKVPLSEMFSYVTSLRSMTEGRGNYTMEFDHYAVAPEQCNADDYRRKEIVSTLTIFVI